MSTHPNITVNRNIYFSPSQWILISDSVVNSDDSILVTSSINFAPEFIWDSKISSEERINQFLLKDEFNSIYVHITSVSKNGVDILISNGGEQDTTVLIDSYDSKLKGFVSREYKCVEPNPCISIDASGNLDSAIAISLNEKEANLSYMQEQLRWNFRGINIFLINIFSISYISIQTEVFNVNRLNLN